jgi:hypothetical protein
MYMHAVIENLGSSKPAVYRKRRRVTVETVKGERYPVCGKSSIRNQRVPEIWNMGSNTSEMYMVAKAEMTEMWGIHIEF